MPRSRCHYRVGDIVTFKSLPPGHTNCDPVIRKNREYRVMYAIEFLGGEQTVTIYDTVEKHDVVRTDGVTTVGIGSCLLLNSDWFNPLPHRINEGAFPTPTPRQRKKNGHAESEG